MPTKESFSSGTESGAFRAFWEAYPKKEGRAAAEKAWMKLSPGEALLRRILNDLSIKRGLAEWQRDGGRFIPRASRYLAERRWEDEGAPGSDLERSYDLNAAFERAVARQRKGL